MAPETVGQAERLLEGARALGRLIEQYRDQGEAERHLPRPLFEAMYGAGLYHMMLSKAFGGAQLSMVEVTRIIEAIAVHDGAVAWNLFISAAAGLFADHLPEDAARMMYSIGTNSGSFTPSGEAVVVEGGYRVSGTWPFASGCHNASFLLGGCRIIEDGQPRMLPDGRPEIRLLIMSASECELLDTWHSVGLRGTGSHHFQARDVFVPEDHGFLFYSLFAPPPNRPSTGYDASFFSLQGPPMVAVSLGIARDAIESFKGLAAEKTPRNSATNLAGSPTVQETLGHAEALVRSARAYIYEAAREFDALTDPTPQQREQASIELRLASRHVAANCIEAVDMVFDAAGTSSIYKSSRLERCFRDVHVVNHHTQLSFAVLEQMGAALIGAEGAAAGPALAAQPGPEAEPWLAKTRGLVPVIDAHRDESEAERHMAPAVFEALDASGLYRLRRPRAYGGEQCGVETATRVVEEVSRHDGAAGWNLMIAGHMACLADYLPPEGAREVYGASTRLVAGSFTPRGEVSRVEGGYRVSGRWPFASGCMNAAWLAATGNAAPQGAPPQLRLFFMPVSECRIVDTWRTAGLRGTGSHDFEAQDVFVPDHRSFAQADFYSGPRGHADPAYPRSFFDDAAPPMAAVSLGIAREAIDVFRALAAAKTPLRSTSTLAAQSPAHRRLARAESLLRCARAYVYEVTRALDEPKSDDEAATLELTAAVRLACAFAAESATQAVDLMFDAAGGSSIYETSRLERCFRDVHMVTHHVLVAPSHFEMVGQYLLGGGLQFRR